MGISMRHVVWCAATLSLGSFFYVLTLEPMDETQNPRAAALGRVTPRSAKILHVRRSLAMGQIVAAERQTLELRQQHPEDLAAVFYRAMVMEELGRGDEARSNWRVLALLTRGLDSWQQRYSREQVVYYRAWAVTGLGRLDEGQGEFERLADRLEAQYRDEQGLIASSGVHYNLACYRSMAGQLEAAMAHWERAVELGYMGSVDEQGWWAVDPDLEPLHDIERFWEIGSMGMGRDTGMRGVTGAGEG